MKAAVVYFSQDGTTAKVADAVAGGLRSAGYSIELSNLKHSSPPDVRNYDLLGIGSPVYYYRLPFNVTDYLKSLPHLQGMPVFYFLLHGTHAFNAVNALSQLLAQRGTRPVGYYHCYGEAYYVGHLKEGYLFSPNHPTQKELKAATEFGGAVAQRVAKGEIEKVKDEPKPPLVFWIEQAMMSRWFVEQVYSRLFKVNPDLCTACGLCMDICPKKNIEKNENGHPVWGRNCLYCLSCEMKCPDDAISSIVSRPGFRMLTRPFMRYNVKHCAQEVGIDYVLVGHSHGRTERSDRCSIDHEF